MSEEQAVANETAPIETVDSAQDLDSLLNEFDASINSTQTKEPEQPNTNELIEFVREEREVRTKQREEEIKQQTANDIKSAVSVISEELEGLNLPERLIRGALYDKAENDPRFLQAWTNRSQDPKTFNKILKSFAKEVKGDFDNVPDRQATEDREALAAAVRSANTRSAEPETVDVTTMSDQEFHAYKHRLARGG